MCPRPNLWRQLGFDLALQSRAKPVSRERTSRPAAVQDVKPSEVNPFLVGKMIPGSMQTSSLEKHARELLAQILKGSRSIVTDSGNGLIQVIRDEETGEITVGGAEEMQRQHADAALESMKVEEDTVNR